jgi:hypothetical protein
MTFLLVTVEAGRVHVIAQLCFIAVAVDISQRHPNTLRNAKRASDQLICDVHPCACCVPIRQVFSPWDDFSLVPARHCETPLFATDSTNLQFTVMMKLRGFQ